MVVPAELKDVLVSWQRWALGLEGLAFNQVARCAIGHRLVESGHSVLFAPAYRLVQDLLAAKRDLALPRQLRKLDTFNFLLLDDLGYLPQGAEESQVAQQLAAAGAVDVSPGHRDFRLDRRGAPALSGQPHGGPVPAGQHRQPPVGKGQAAYALVGRNVQYAELSPPYKLRQI